MDYRTCRICKTLDDKDDMVYYAMRSFGHHSCLLAKHMTLESGVAWLLSLRPHQLEFFPVIRMSDWLCRIGRSEKNALSILKGVLAASRKEVENEGPRKPCKRCQCRRPLDSFAEKGKHGPDVCGFCTNPLLFAIPNATPGARRLGLRVARGISAGRPLQRGRRG